MIDYKFISVDHHIGEHPDAFKRAQKEYGDRAPRVIENPPGLGKGLWIVADQMKPMRSAYFAMGYIVDKHKPGGSIAEDALHFKNAVQNFIQNFRYEDFPQTWESSAYVKAMDEDNVEAALVLSSWTRINYLHTDARFQRSVFNSYNEWIMDFASYAPKRLFPAPLISILDVDQAVKDITDYVKRGCKSVHIPTTIDDDAYFNPKYEPLWAAASDLGIPLTVHSGSSQGGHQHGSWGDTKRAYDPREFVIHRHPNPSSSSECAWQFVSNLIFSGVFDRYPKLKVASVEFHVGEAASVYANIDYQYTREAAVDPERTINKRFPSEYLRDNVFWGFEDDPVAVRAAGIYGEDNYMWGSDFPHHTSTYPHSHELLEQIGLGMDPGILRKMYRDNANKVYKLV